MLACVRRSRRRKPTEFIQPCLIPKFSNKQCTASSPSTIEQLDMGGWSGSWNSWFGAKTDDPLGKLDPKVRKFLEQESPVKVSGAQRQQEAAAAAKEQAAADDAQQQAAAAARARADDPNAVPPQSLFPDGRYAHLWKTYRPQGEVEAETKTDQEKLHDVLDAFKSRKNSIGLAAIENCAEEQLDWSDCMRSGSLRARMFMCRDEVRKFESCYNMQTVCLPMVF